MDLYSVNYLHFGAPKSWFCIPPEHQKRFKMVVKDMLPDLFRGCPEFLRHKVCRLGQSLEVVTGAGVQFAAEVQGGR